MIWRDTFLVKFILCVVALVTRAFHTHYVPKIRCKGRYGPLYTWHDLISSHYTPPVLLTLSLEHSLHHISHLYSLPLPPALSSSRLQHGIFQAESSNICDRLPDERAQDTEDAEVEKYQLTRRHTNFNTTPAPSIEQEAHFTQTTHSRLPVFTVSHAVSLHTRASFTSKHVYPKETHISMTQQ